MIRGVSNNSVPTPITIPAIPVRSTPRRKSSNSHKVDRVSRRGTNVFVVHGRNLAIKDSMFSFLRAVGLKPLEWNVLIKLTKQPAPYVGTILDTAFREAAAVVVLFTPDDEARLIKSFH